MLKASLIVINGESADKEIPLKLPAIIGRGRESAVQVQHSLVSRLHCEILEREGRLYVRDLQSLNGTYINNFRIQDEEPLMPSQLLTLGNITFRANYEIVRAKAPQQSGNSRPEPAAAVKKIEPSFATQTSKTADVHSRPTQQPAAASANSRTQTDRSNALDDFDFSVTQQKSISLSALNDLPEIGPAVSFVGEIAGAPEAKRAEYDTDELDILGNDSNRRAKINADDSALGSFIRRNAR